MSNLNPKAGDTVFMSGKTLEVKEKDSGILTVVDTAQSPEEDVVKRVMKLEDIRAAEDGEKSYLKVDFVYQGDIDGFDHLPEAQPTEAATN